MTIMQSAHETYRSGTLKCDLLPGSLFKFMATTITLDGPEVEVTPSSDYYDDRKSWYFMRHDMDPQCSELRVLLHFSESCLVYLHGMKVIRILQEELNTIQEIYLVLL